MNVKIVVYDCDDICDERTDSIELKDGCMARHANELLEGLVAYLKEPASRKHAYIVWKLGLYSDSFIRRTSVLSDDLERVREKLSELLDCAENELSS
jgi:hypothetical protein